MYYSYMYSTCTFILNHVLTQEEITLLTVEVTWVKTTYSNHSCTCTCICLSKQIIHVLYNYNYNVFFISQFCQLCFGTSLLFARPNQNIIMQKYQFHVFNIQKNTQICCPRKNPDHHTIHAPFSSFGSIENFLPSMTQHCIILNNEL